MVMLRWSVWGDEVIERELLRFSEHMVNMMPVAEVIMQDIRDSNQEQFDSEGGHASGGWAPLADSTLAGKIAGGWPVQILHRTLRLRKSLTEIGHPDQIDEALPSGFAFGSTVEYGEYHQRGTVNMPARPPLAFTELDKVSWVKRLQRYALTGEITSTEASVIS